MDVPTTTSLKLPSRLRSRVAALAKRSGRSAHSLMLEAIERHTTYEERMREFVKEAMAADRAIDRSGEVYASSDVHAWLDRLATGTGGRRPKLWRR
jgi:predicted transcriptional regulator